MKREIILNECDGYDEEEGCIKNAKLQLICPIIVDLVAENKILRQRLHQSKQRNRENRDRLRNEIIKAKVESNNYRIGEEYWRNLMFGSKEHLEIIKESYGFGREKE